MDSELDLTTFLSRIGGLPDPIDFAHVERRIDLSSNRKFVFDDASSAADVHPGSGCFHR